MRNHIRAFILKYRYAVEESGSDPRIEEDARERLLEELLSLTNNIKCLHPNHIDGISCRDYAVGCDSNCLCCIDKIGLGGGL